VTINFLKKTNKWYGAKRYLSELSPDLLSVSEQKRLIKKISETRSVERPIVYIKFSMLRFKRAVNRFLLHSVWHSLPQ